LLSLIAAGAIGNMIDRIRYDYVVDFIYFVFINFPIFNVADIYVSISTFVLIFILLFYYKEEDLNFISFKQKRYRKID
jgi:signal peptidase II